MARTEGQWQKGLSLITPSENVPVLLRNTYLNFGGETIGETGYGIRDNAGVMEFKNDSGAWAGLGTGGGSLDGSGTANEIAYWVDTDTLGALTVATYPSLAELAHIKGATSAIQTQLNARELLSNKATDFSTVNDTLYPTVEAVQEYVTAAVVGLLDYRGTYDASTNLFPATGGSGLAGAILKGDFWVVSIAGTLGGTAVTTGDLVIALVDTPAQTAANWDIVANEASGGGDVFKVGTPVNNQIGVWTGDGTIEGDAALTFDTTTNTLETESVVLSPSGNNVALTANGSGSGAGIDITHSGSGTKLNIGDTGTGDLIDAGAGKFKVTDAGVISASGLTASEMLATDASKNLQSLPVATYPSLAEFAHVKGVTSAVQTQLNAKENLSNKSTDTNLGTSNTLYPTQNAVKTYVDAVAQGLAIKESVRLATAAALPANTYNNGASGVGATLTAVVVGVLTVDGVAVILNDRVLIKDEVTAANNGIYVCTVAGTAGVAYVLTRSTSFDQGTEISGAFTFVEEGSTNADNGFVCTTNDTITVGTTSIAFTQFSGAGQITAGAALTKSGNTLDVAVDNSTIEISGDALRVKDGGLPLAKLADSAVVTAADTIASNDNDTTVPTTAAVIDYVQASLTGTTPLTANQSLVAGQPVGISNIKGGVSLSSKSSVINAHGGTSVSTMTGGNNLICPIGGDKMVILLDSSNAAGTLYAQVVTLDTMTNGVTLGTIATVATATVTSTAGSIMAVCKLDTDKFVAFYLADASATNIQYRVGTVSGTTISWGTAATFVTAASTVATSAAFCANQISTDKGVFVFKAATETNGRAVVFTASGTVLTAGTPAAMGTIIDSNSPALVKKIGTDRFAIVSLVTGAVYAQIGTCVGGTTITFGSNTALDAIDASSTQTLSTFSIANHTTDALTVMYRSNTNLVRLVAATVSGTTITTGTPVSISGSTSLQEGGLWAQTATTLYTISGSETWKATLSGTTITAAGLAANKTSKDLVPGFMFGVTDNNIPNLHAVNPTNVVSWMYGMSNNHIGFVENSPASGATANVVTYGTTANQSNLIEGLKYLVAEGTLSPIAHNITIDTADDIYIVTAISSTQVKI